MCVLCSQSSSSGGWSNHLQCTHCEGGNGSFMCILEIPHRCSHPIGHADTPPLVHPALCLRTLLLAAHARPYHLSPRRVTQLESLSPLRADKYVLQSYICCSQPAANASGEDVTQRRSRFCFSYDLQPPSLRRWYSPAADELWSWCVGRHFVRKRARE